MEKIVATSLAELLDRHPLPNVAENDVSFDEVMESVSTAAGVAHDQAVVTVPLVHVGRRREGTVRPAASAASPEGVDGSIVDMIDDVMVDAEDAADQAGVAELVRVAVIMVTRLAQSL
ncbi:uncharacterized protein KRP23_9414 [Phytophthora ramorum]|uniref:uncharacterized protein n=1 Tax=Phytophthora ramorum TaxID=164328 RepID=UPI00309AD3FA|nr:hypothetical protein KRP23_9414 [Phytophthora ramorum]